MLSTSEKLAAKLAEAISNPPITQTAVAEHCGVTKQAVQGWLRNGRIDKKHLSTLARITGRPLEWWLDNGQAVDDEKTVLLKTLKDWRLKASPRSLRVIDQLTVLAQKNTLRDEDWQLIEQLAARLNQPSP